MHSEERVGEDHDLPQLESLTYALTRHIHTMCYGSHFCVVTLIESYPCSYLIWIDITGHMNLCITLASVISVCNFMYMHAVRTALEGVTGSSRR